MLAEPAALPKRWYPLRPHTAQAALVACRTRNCVIEASRRSGKTETAKAIAKALFHSPDAMTRLDLSEFAEPHAVARLPIVPERFTYYRPEDIPVLGRLDTPGAP